MIVVDGATLSHLAGSTGVTIGGLDTRWEIWSPAAPAEVTVALRSAGGAVIGPPRVMTESVPA